MFVRVNGLVVYLLQNSNSTAESEPVFICVMFILDQDLEVETWNATKIGTNHHTLSRSEPDLDF